MQTKTGIARLFDEESENAYDIRLKLSKDVLTIQKQDVVCVNGSDSDSNVSNLFLKREIQIIYDSPQIAK